MRTRTRYLARTTLAVWFASMVLVAGALMGRHLIPLPVAHAAVSATRDQGFAALRLSRDGATWTMVHVLYADCGCSGRIVDHLVGGRRPAGVREVVLLVGEGALGKRLGAAGFEVVQTRADELRDGFGIEAGPLLAVLGADGEVRYAGGYTARKQSLAIQDVEIVERLRSGVRAEELPLYGCPISRGLRAAVNPLGL